MTGLSPSRHILLFAQIDPPLHGQAIMAALLASEASHWSDMRFSVINAVYASDRAALGGFSIGKVFRWISYLARVTTKVVFGRVDTVIMPHAFFRGPFLKDSAFVWLLKKLLHRKLLIWLHMDPNRLQLATLPGGFRRYVGRTLALPDRWVACAPALTATWPAEIPADRAVSVCNGIPDPATAGQADPGNNHRIVFLSAMTEEKGWQELFRVGEKLCDEDGDLEVAFYGGAGAGQTEDSLRARFSRGRHPDRITWRGAAWGETKADALRSAGVFCFPSWTEAFPLAVLDAMAFGLPVVSSDVGAVKNALVPGEGGWLIPARDEAALESGLREALASRDQRARMGAFNRARFLSNFSVKAFGEAWHRLLQTV